MVLIAVVVLILLGVAAWLLYRWIVGAPGALLEGWGESRRRRGYRELTQGLAAVAAGDGAEAQKHARKAEQLLAEPALTLLLSAQAAQLTGDRDGAKRAFDAMLKDDQMAFLGLRGLIGQSLRDGDQTQALGYAERAFALRPQTPWVVHSLFDMQAQAGQWRAAQETLDAGHPPQGRERRQGPHPEGAAAGRAQPRGRARRPRQPTRWRWRAKPLAWRRNESRRPAGWPSCRSRRATPSARLKTLERGWSVAPHPDLAELYLKASGESEPLKRIGVVRRLATRNADDIESHLALAKASLDAGLWGEARRQLETAGGTSPPVRVCRLMAEVEERANADQAKVHDWLARAAEAPADRSWSCTACGAHHETWRSVCESCGAFGTLQWRAPGTYGQILPPEAQPAMALPMPATNNNTT